MTNSENHFTTSRVNPLGRFSELLRQPARERLPHNQPLLERVDWVIVPTIGAIVPNWLIAVPRKPIINIRDWIIQYGMSPKNIMDDLNVHIKTTYSDLIWFEHGPASFNSPVGCGTDHAHLHIIFRPDFTFAAFAEQSISSSNLTWQHTAPDSAYESLPDTGSYLIAGSGSESIFTYHVESTGSQFFRRIVSVLAGRVDAWNYKHFPHADNVTKTIENFRYLEALD